MLSISLYLYVRTTRPSILVKNRRRKSKTTFTQCYFCRRKLTHEAELVGDNHPRQYNDSATQIIVCALCLRWGIAARVSESPLVARRRNIFKPFEKVVARVKSSRTMRVVRLHRRQLVKTIWTQKFQNCSKPANEKTKEGRCTGAKAAHIHSRKQLKEHR